MYTCVQCQQKPKEESDPLELELQAFVSHLEWVPGTELGSSVTDALIVFPVLYSSTT